MSNESKSSSDVSTIASFEDTSDVSVARPVDLEAAMTSSFKSTGSSTRPIATALIADPSLIQTVNRSSNRTMRDTMAEQPSNPPKVLMLGNAPPGGENADRDKNDRVFCGILPLCCRFCALLTIVGLSLGAGILIGKSMSSDNCVLGATAPAIITTVEPANDGTAAPSLDESMGMEAPPKPVDSEEDLGATTTSPTSIATATGSELTPTFAPTTLGSDTTGGPSTPEDSLPPPPDTAPPSRDFPGQETLPPHIDQSFPLPGDDSFPPPMDSSPPMNFPPSFDSTVPPHMDQTSFLPENGLPPGMDGSIPSMDFPPAFGPGTFPPPFDSDMDNHHCDRDWDFFHGNAHYDPGSALDLGHFGGSSLCQSDFFSTSCEQTNWVGFTSHSGTRSQWFKATASESSFFCQGDVEHRVKLTVPQGVNYDLHIYKDSDTGAHISSNNAAGVDEQMVVSSRDLPLNNDYFDYFIMVQYRSGPCDIPWTLEVVGHDCFE